MTVTPHGALTRKWIVVRDPSSVALMRRRISAKLTAWDLGLAPDADDDVRLIVSELVTNAVRYDTSNVPVLTVGLVVAPSRGELYVEVLDGTPPEPAPNSRSRSDSDGQPSEGGRGLILVAMLATRWGIEPTETGKRVWATIALPQAPGLAERVREQLRARMRASAPCPRVRALTQTA
ncbi:ATP-binding protein [Streptacidiphilus neutrinimicus]|uniref:ATP-binding protein n=1 Tax=Streptacidiphilus neutrinimicus TaxID=105420 RepID=UPI0005AB50A7|nr:ATP-binding protein [Streptacidiphilus neutrinimicus]